MNRRKSIVIGLCVTLAVCAAGSALVAYGVGVYGRVSHSSTEPTSILVHGWAFDFHGFKPVTEVIAFVDGERWGEATPRKERLRGLRWLVSKETRQVGFELKVPKEIVLKDANVRVFAKGERGMRELSYSGKFAYRTASAGAESKRDRTIATSTKEPSPKELRLSAAEVAQLVDWRRDSFLDEGDRRPIRCEDIPRNARTAVLLVLGQSNAANHGETIHAPKDHVFNFNPFSGNCFAARDPLLGATGGGGSFASRLGSRLIESGLFSEVVLVSIGVGGTRMEEWAPAGVHHPRLLLTLKRLEIADFEVRFVLWHQGEGNALPQIDAEAYKNHFRGILAAIRSRKILAPVFVPLVSICGGGHHPPVRQAQSDLVRPELGVFPGPDTDTLGLKERYDSCHFSGSGLDKHAELWFETIKQFVARRDDSALKRVTAKSIGAGAETP